MKKITVIVLTKNDEKNIVDCLESVSEFEEIIVVDDYSTDRTLEVIRNLSFFYKIHIFQNNLDANFSKQRNFGLKKAKYDWVLFIDSDERVTKELLIELRSADVQKYSGFYIKRRDIMWGKELKYGETGNIKLLRFGAKDKGQWGGSVHEVWSIKGSRGNIKGSIIHYPHQTVKEFLEEIDFYSTIRAKELMKEGVKASILSIIFFIKGKFILNYLFKMGFMDGIPGLLVALLMSLHSFFVRAKLFLLLKNNY